jgi:hypothetical protein
MAAAATTRRALGSGRVLLVLAAIAGVVGMHALVVSVPTSVNTAHAAHTIADPNPGPGTDLAVAPLAAAPDPAGTAAAGSHGSGHDPADHTGLAHLCLALAAAIFLLLVRRVLVRAVLAGPPGPVHRVRSAAARWIRPPPDVVGVLCVSRT